jgi:NitT/TauT family transport system ATP-binding protein
LDHPDTLTETEIIGELRHVSKSYSTDGGREYKVLDQIDLAVREGELLALLGQSGSGKSTMVPNRTPQAYGRPCALLWETA